MKLLIYSHFFAPSIGGVETIVRSLASGLAELRNGAGSPKFDVTVATQTPIGNFPAEESGFRVVRQPRRAMLRRLIHECDVMHVAGPSILPMALALLAGKPFAVEHHGYQTVCLNGLLVHQPDGGLCPGNFQMRKYRECARCERSREPARSGYRALVLTGIRNWLARRAKANIAVSGHVDKRVALPRSTVIYHGIEAASFSGGASKTNNVCFAYVGRFVAEKGIDIFLKATASVKKSRQDFTVKLVGDGPERERLERLIDSLEIRDVVTIAGYLTGSALEDLLRDVSVVVMPSVWEETAGLAAMEQMMRGRLVIASQVGGLAEIVGDAGMTFALGSSDELSQCMQRVLEQPALIESYGRMARVRASELFQKSRMIEQHASLYRQLAS